MEQFDLAKLQPKFNLYYPRTIEKYTTLIKLKNKEKLSLYYSRLKFITYLLTQVIALRSTSWKEKCESLLVTLIYTI